MKNKTPLTKPTTDNLYYFKYGHFYFKDDKLIFLTLDELQLISKCENPQDVYKPVPLTKEILLAYGFHYQRPIGRVQEYYGFYIDSTIFKLTYDSSKNAFIHREDKSIYRFKYFHQLQDFLYRNYRLFVRENFKSNIQINLHAQVSFRP